MTGYRDAIIPSAAKAYDSWDVSVKHQSEMFINVIKDVSDEICSFTNVEDAAEDSIEYGADYLGTIHLVPGKAPVWLNLTRHGFALDEENEQEAIYEEAHEREVALTRYSGGAL